MTAWTAASPDGSGPRLFDAEVTRLSEIEAEPVIWLHEGRIPLAALSVAAGREGCGKSQHAAMLSAAVTTGRVPGALYGQPRSVIYISSEDSYAHTIVPRLIAAGADLTRVFRLRVREMATGTSLSMCLPDDNDVLREAITRLGAALVVFDPLLSVLAGRLNANQGREVRLALDPLAKIAEDTCCSFWGIMHFSKATGRDVAEMIAHSGAFKDAARAVFGFALDSGDTGIMSQVKNSLGRKPDMSDAYRIETTWLEFKDRWEQVPRFTFTGPTRRHVENLIDRGAASALAAAKDYLLGALQGGPRAASELIEEAKQAHDIAEKTLRRARHELDIKVSKQAGKWTWELRLPASSMQNGWQSWASWSS